MKIEQDHSITYIYPFIAENTDVHPFEGYISVFNGWIHTDTPPGTQQVKINFNMALNSLSIEEAISLRAALDKAIETGQQIKQANS